MPNAEIVTAGFYVPEEIIDNESLINSPNNPYLVYVGEDESGKPIFQKEDSGEFKRVMLDHAKIKSVTGGIEQRRRTAPRQTVVDLIEQAFKQADFPADKLEGIIIGTVSQDGFPSAACRVQHRLGARNASYVEDVRAACSGFTHALDLARLRIQETGGYFLVAGAEILTKITDYTELNCDLFGDGCGLVVLGPTENKSRGILANRFMSDASGLDYIFRDSMGLLRMPNGPAVFRNATRGMLEMAHSLVADANIPEAQIAKYFPHQANGRILDWVEEKVDPAKLGRIYRNISRYGNMSAATVPVAFAEAYRAGSVKKGDPIVMVDMGSGLSFGGALIVV